MNNSSAKWDITYNRGPIYGMVTFIAAVDPKPRSAKLKNAILMYHMITKTLQVSIITT